ILLSGKAPVDSKIPADATPGIVSLRAKNEFGLSNSRNFLVTSEPWSIVAGNETESNAFPMTSGQYFQDECPDRGRNFYRIRFERDTQIEIHSYARSLDSRARLNMLIQLSASPQSSQSIATANSTIDRDATLIANLKANTDYTLVVSDHLFRGGPEYRYAIFMKSIDGQSTLQADPLRASDAWTSICDMLAKLRTPNGEAVFDPRFVHQRNSMLRPPSVDGNPVIHTEQISNNDQALAVTWPVKIAGSFDSNDDVDAFDFECDKEANVVIEIVSQRVGELTDCLLVIERIENKGQPNEKRTRIADNDDGPVIGNGEMRFLNKDSLISFRAPAQGTYRLIVRNQQRFDMRSRSPSYVVEIRQPNPGFLLSTHWAFPIRDLDQSRLTSNTISTGGVLMLTVHAIRYDGFSEPIDIRVEGLPADIVGGAGIIASDQSATTISLWHDTQKSAGPDVQDIARLQVVGHANRSDKDKPTVVIATPLEVVWNQIDTFRSPLSKLSSSLLLNRSQARTCPLTIELGPKSTDLQSRSPSLNAVRGQPLKVPVNVTRRPGGEASVVTLRLRQFPTKATAAEVKIEAKSNEGSLDLQIPKDAPLGEYMLSALCEAPVSVPNTDPAAKDKNVNLTLQLPSSSIRIKIGDAP
ncbi:MAG: hypothetical protein ABL921_29525, partial [Pirellula sp.]